MVFIHHLTPHEVVVAAIRKLGLHPDRFMSNNFGFRLIHGTRQLGHTDAVPEVIQCDVGCLSKGSKIMSVSSVRKEKM